MTYSEAGISEVLCFTTHTHRRIEYFAPDELDIITPNSPQSLIADPYKICIVSNMCIDSSGKVHVFLPDTSDVPNLHASNPFFTSDRDFIRKLLMDHPINGVPRFPIPSRVEVRDITLNEFQNLETKKSNHQFRMTSKWISLHAPLFWSNYYHTIIDGFYKVFVLLRQVSHVMEYVSSFGAKSTRVSPTFSYDSMADILTKKDYELFILTKSPKFPNWVNRVVNTTEKAFVQPVIADIGNGEDSYTCSSKGVIGISFSHYRNLFYTFESRVVPRPPKEAILMTNQYFSFIKQSYGYSNEKRKNPKLNILLIRRVKNRVITNLDEIYKTLKINYGDVCEIQIRENFKHSFDEQIAYHQWADVIIVSHGADETNTFLTREGTVIIEVESPQHYEPYFPVYAHLLKLRHYMFRGSGGDKNSNRIVDIDAFVKFFEAALCYGDSFIGNERIKQNSVDSGFCKRIKLENKYSETDVKELLSNRMNIFERFDTDQSLTEIKGEYLIGCCLNE
ncbi:predicted protein [Naegleria gruberi]|uniref:Predicted protein n=1 Tax=Naegleria gruberi TaxID=5762 RepID=D2VTN5_NAEGR|nr:uncharacterized protein NAEGRDRAFT_52159 [Naegleria gruberi]EFC39682.1 predicted protein [Naegleria gruberi]|eukprot:XP_002672426.1 predicted protein [Naegleria gruberi strain NEG-M]